MILKFIQWLKERQFHQYKDGTWYTTQERPYTQGKQRKFYSDEELRDLFVQEVVTSFVQEVATKKNYLQDDEDDEGYSGGNCGVCNSPLNYDGSCDTNNCSNRSK